MAIKPLTIEQQLKRLKEHNIVFSDLREAKKQLVNINYFRVKFYACLLGEWLNDKNGDKLKNKLQLNKIYDLYLIDLKFSSIILSGIISIEKYLRSKFACEISCAFNIRNIKDNNFLTLYKLDKREDTRTKIIEKTFTRSSKELPFQHNITKYGFVPPWCFVEYTECGDLIRLIRNLDDSKSNVARIKNSLLNELHKTNLQVLKDVRNKIAHGNPMVNNCPNGQRYINVLTKMFQFIKEINPTFYRQYKNTLIDFENKNPEYIKLLFDRQDIKLKKLLK